MVLIKSPYIFKVTIAKDGRFVAIIKKSDFLYLQNIVP